MQETMPGAIEGAPLSSKPAGAAPRWPASIVLLHWLTVCLIVLGVAVVYARDLADVRWWRDVLLNMHRWAGMLIWTAAFVRIALRFFRRSAAPGRATGRFARYAATATHGVLYALLLTAPLIGLALGNARGQSQAGFGLHLPIFVEADPDLADALETAHRVVALTLLGLATFHLLAAAWHHLVLRDGVLRSMSLRVSKATELDSPPSPPPTFLPTEHH